MMTREEILAIYDAGSDAVIALVEGLLNQIEKLSFRVQEQDKLIEKLTDRVTKLEAQLSKTSENSSKPPSSDGLKRKNRSLRIRSGRKPGGQEGHAGSTLSFCETPHEVKNYTAEVCSRCGQDLSAIQALIHERRQVFELPEIRLHVTEHQAEIKACPVCHSESKGVFPEDVKQGIQYGSQFKALTVYLNQYHLLPYERLGELLTVVCGQSISEGSVFNAIQGCSENLSEFESTAKAVLSQAKVLNHDETGVRVGQKLHWVHSASTADWTWYQVHTKRGQEATTEIGILPEFAGILAHDHWKPYFQYNCAHALCNAHHLRELKFIQESYKQAWAGEMADLLRDINTAVKTCSQSTLSQSERVTFEKRYTEILAVGMEMNPLIRKRTHQRGRQKQSPARNLLERLSNYQQEVLRFMYDFQVPFDNNQAERDIRMVKLHQKISGCFRSMAGAEAFCRIRSYISTMKKQGFDLIDSLAQVIRGQPVIPSFSPPDFR